MSRLRLEKVARRVRLLLADGSSLGAELFFSPDSPAGPGPQTVPELVAEAGPVLPARLDGGGFALVGTEALVAVVEPDPVPGDPEWAAPVPAEALLAGGHRLAGELLAEPGARLTDLMRREDPWFRMRTGVGALWVRKSRLLVLKPLPE